MDRALGAVYRGRVPMFRFGFMDEPQSGGSSMHVRADSIIEDGNVAGCDSELAAEVEEIQSPVSCDEVLFTPLWVRAMQLQRVAGEGNIAGNPETDLIPGVYEGTRQPIGCCRIQFTAVTVVTLFVYMLV